MRWDCKILVMRRAPMIGRPTSAPRISVYHRASRLEWAIHAARAAAAGDARRGIPSTAYWIERAGQPARRRA